MTTAFDDELIAYFADREAARIREVQALLACMTKRERALIREVAVMANVRASRHDDTIPPDSTVLINTLSSCLNMPDLYPTIARIARRAARRPAAAPTRTA